MRRHVASLTIAAVALLANPTAHGTTLWHIWRKAVVADPAFSAAQAQLQALQQARPQALAALLPKVAVQASAGLQSSKSEAQELAGDGPQTYTYSTQGRLDVTSWSVSLTQPLFDWGALQNFHSAYYTVAAAAADYQAQTAALAVKVVRAYITWRSDIAVLEALKAGEQGFEVQAKRTADAYQAGETGIIGMDEAEVAYQNSRSQVFGATANLHGARYALVSMLGGDAHDLATTALSTTLGLPDIGDLQHWQMLARQDNPRLASLQAQFRSAEHRVSSARGGYLPSISAELSYAGSNQDGNLRHDLGDQPFYASGDQATRGGMASLNLSWNIFSGGAVRAKVDAAQARTEEALANLRQERLALDATVRRRYDDFRYDAQQIRTERAALVVATRAVRAADEGAKAGVISENNAINDRQTMLQLQQNLVQNIAAAFEDYIELVKAAGLATPTMVHHLSGILD